MSGSDFTIATAMRRIAHDLRSPIASILGNVRFVLGEAGIPEQTREALEDTLEATEQLNRLLSDLLDVSRWIDGALEARPAALVVGELIAESVEGHGTRLARRNQRVDTIGEVATSVRADVDLLRRALHNVLRAALLQSPAGATVQVEVTAEERFCRIAVADLGRAMDAREREALLAAPRPEAVPLLVGHRSPGLVLARAAVEVNGGSLDVGSTDRGGLVVICVPLA